MITLEQVLCIFVALHLKQLLFAIKPAKAVLAPTSIYALPFAAPHSGPALTLPAFEFECISVASRPHRVCSTFVGLPPLAVAERVGYRGGGGGR